MKFIYGLNCKKAGDFLLPNLYRRWNGYYIEDIEGKDYQLENNLCLFRELSNSVIIIMLPF